MANILKSSKTVEKLVETREDVFVLTLSTDEARALRSVVGYVSGDSDNTPRKYTDAIYNALVPHVAALVDWTTQGQFSFVERSKW